MISYGIIILPLICGWSHYFGSRMGACQCWIGGDPMMEWSGAEWCVECAIADWHRPMKEDNRMPRAWVYLSIVTHHCHSPLRYACSVFCEFAARLCCMSPSWEWMSMIWDETSLRDCICYLTNRRQRQGEFVGISLIRTTIFRHSRFPLYYHWSKIAILSLVCLL